VTILRNIEEEEKRRMNNMIQRCKSILETEKQSKGWNFGDILNRSNQEKYLFVVISRMLVMNGMWTFVMYGKINAFNIYLINILLHMK